jgi:hypothetical protein
VECKLNFSCILCFQEQSLSHGQKDPGQGCEIPDPEKNHPGSGSRISDTRIPVPVPKKTKFLKVESFEFCALFFETTSAAASNWDKFWKKIPARPNPTL